MIELVLFFSIVANLATVYIAYYFFEKKERYYIQAILSKDATELKLLQDKPEKREMSLPPLPDLAAEASLDDEEWYKLIDKEKGKSI